MTARAATAEDLPAVSATLADAFHDDPLWGPWALPDETTRPDRLTRLMGFWARCGMRYSGVRMTEGAESVAVWVPAGESEMTPAEEGEFGQLIGDLWGPREAEVLQLFEQFEANHPRDQPHYYLSLWGTHSDHARQGFGGALIAENLKRIDAERKPAYLESTNPVNLPRYEALGFDQLATFAPPDGPVITPMWREPR